MFSKNCSVELAAVEATSTVKRSRSPSPSMSTKFGATVLQALDEIVRPKGLLTWAAKVGAVLVPLFL